MKLKEYIESLNEFLPEKLKQYRLTVEKEYQVFKLNSEKNVILYSTVLESELETLKLNFLHYIEPTTMVSLYAHFTNVDNQVIKIRLGKFTYMSPERIYLNLYNLQYKNLIKAVKKALGEKPQKGYAHSYINILNKDIATTKYTKYHLPKKVDVYTCEFGDKQTLSFAKDNAYSALHFMMLNDLSMEKVSKKITYKFEQKVEELHFV